MKRFSTQAAFAGTVASGCSEKTLLDESLSPLALGVSLEPVLVQLLNALAAAGKKDANIISDIDILRKAVL